MASAQRFTIDPDRVVHDTIEGETVVIHLKTGTYYSLRDTAADIWEMLDDGWSSDQVVAELARRSDNSVDAVSALVKEFVLALAHEELIERCDGSSSEPPSGAVVPTNEHGAAHTNGSGPTQAHRTASAPANRTAPSERPSDQPPAREEFEPPAFQKYTDMQYFLLLDPVHEVEASGWPHSDGSLSA